MSAEENFLLNKRGMKRLVFVSILVICNSIGKAEHRFFPANSIRCLNAMIFNYAEDEEGNIVSGLGVYKIEGNVNRCELKDYFIIDSFCDAEAIKDLVNTCITFSKKYYNSICIKVTDDDLILMNVLINKKFKLLNEEIDSLELLENQKLYLLKYKIILDKRIIAVL